MATRRCPAFGSQNSQASRCQTVTFAAPAAYAGKVADYHRRKKPDSANSCRFHSTPLPSRQRSAPLARSFIPLHSTLESSETGRMNRPCHAFTQEPWSPPVAPATRKWFWKLWIAFCNFAFPVNMGMRKSMSATDDGSAVSNENWLSEQKLLETIGDSFYSHLFAKLTFIRKT